MYRAPSWRQFWTTSHDRQSSPATASISLRQNVWNVFTDLIVLPTMIAGIINDASVQHAGKCCFLRHRCGRPGLHSGLPQDGPYPVPQPPATLRTANAPWRPQNVSMLVNARRSDPQFRTILLHVQKQQGLIKQTAFFSLLFMQPCVGKVCKVGVCMAAPGQEAPLVYVLQHPRGLGDQAEYLLTCAMFIQQFGHCVENLLLRWHIRHHF